MKVIGLTGGIGTGKSTVEEIFKSLGVDVIDADKVVHTLYRKDEIKRKVKELFGEGVFTDGEIDRKKLADLVFSDSLKRKAIERLIHPEVEKYIQDWLEEIKSKNDSGIAIVSVPLMIETGSYRKYQKIILVYAPKDKQIERLLKKGYTLEDAVRRIEAQMDIDEKLKFADYVIMNTSTIEHLKDEVERVLNEIKADP